MLFENFSKICQKLSSFIEIRQYIEYFNMKPTYIYNSNSLNSNTVIVKVL